MEHGLLMTDLSNMVIQLTGAEAARDFIQAMPGSTPTRKSVKMDAQEARSVAKGYLQEPGTGLDQTKGGFSGHVLKFWERILMSFGVLFGRIGW